MEWVLWTNKSDAGRPVVLHWWIGSTSKPTDLFWVSYDESKPPKIARDLRGQVDPGIANATKGDYAVSTVAAADRICNSPTLREFWRSGRTILVDTQVYPRLLDCDANTPRSKWFDTNGKALPNAAIKVWSIAVKLSDRALVYCWTPCKLGVVKVYVPGFGDVQVNLTNRSSAYMIATPSGIVWSEVQ
jgi:hypothetical protein